MSTDIFRHADESLTVMINDMSVEYQNLGTSLGFDELNVLETRKRVNAMYKRMDTVIQREYRKIARRAYNDGCKDCGFRIDGFDPYEFVYAMLRAYDPLSDFIYTREWTRKRESGNAQEPETRIRRSGESGKAVCRQHYSRRKAESI